MSSGTCQCRDTAHEGAANADDVYVHSLVLALLTLLPAFKNAVNPLHFAFLASCKPGVYIHVYPLGGTKQCFVQDTALPMDAPQKLLFLTVLNTGNSANNSIDEV
jgi:hypothetical protein